MFIYNIMDEQTIQVLSGVLDDVRPPVLDFKVIDNTKDYKEYLIKKQINILKIRRATILSQIT